VPFCVPTPGAPRSAEKQAGTNGTLPLRMNAFRFAFLTALLTVAACSSSSSDGVTADAAGDTLIPGCKTVLDEEASFDGPIPASWCAANDAGAAGGRRAAKACDGYLTIAISEGVDCSMTYVFDAATKKLVGKIHQCNLIRICVAGVPGFKPPSEACMGGGFGDGGPVCTASDAGVDAVVDSPTDTSDAAHD
jgi:hypothetical protein